MVAGGEIRAQETAAIEEVVVTAQRREENLQRVPAAVSALSGEALAESGAADLRDVALLTPSVTLKPTRATNSTLTAFIRGVGQQDPLAGFEPGVALYVDDVYIARPQGALLDLYDVERVEVLRGPQGTLYGRNAVGGAIKYVTRRLGGEPEFRLRAALGDFGRKDVVGAGSVPVSDSFRMGAAVASFERDGFGVNLATGGENYNKKALGYRVSAEYEPSPALLLRLVYDKTDDDSGPVAGHRPFPAAFSEAPVLRNVRDTRAGAARAISTAGMGGDDQVVSEGFHVALDWSIDANWTFRSISARRDNRSRSAIDFDSLESMDFEAPVVYDNEQFSQEFQLLYSGGRMDLVAGMYYLDARAANDFDIVLGLLHPLGSTAYTGGEIDTRAWSAFADLTWGFTDRLSLSVGGRYTNDTRAADVFRANYLGIGSPAFGNRDAVRTAVTSDYEAEKSFVDFSPRLNLSFQARAELLLYAGWSQGFKSGGFDPRGANFASPEVEQGYDPETLDSFEAGVKAVWAEGRALTNIAAFHTHYRDMQIPGTLSIDSDGDGVNDDFVGAVTNAGSAKIGGLEFEGVFLLGNSLSANLVVSKLNPRIEEWISNGENIADRRRIQNTPESMYVLGLTYRTEVGAGSLSAGFNWTHTGDTTQLEYIQPIVDQASHSIKNASIVWTAADDRWRIGLHGRNLGDEDIKTAGYCLGSGGCLTQLGLEDNTTIFYGPPRTWTAAVEYRF